MALAVCPHPFGSRLDTGGGNEFAVEAGCLQKDTEHCQNSPKEKPFPHNDLGKNSYPTVRLILHVESKSSAVFGLQTLP